MANAENNVMPAGVVSFYFNGFHLGLSNADVNATLTLNNAPAVAINMSYTTAKTLSVALNELITTLERVTERQIMTTKDVSLGLEMLGSSENKNIDLN